MQGKIQLVESTLCKVQILIKADLQNMLTIMIEKVPGRCDLFYCMDLGLSTENGKILD